MYSSLAKSKNYGGIDPSPLLAQQKAGSATMNQQQIDSVKTKPSESLPTKQEPPIKQEPQNVQKPTNNNISPMLSVIKMNES